MAMANETKAWHRAYREAHVDAARAAQKRWHDAHGKEHYQKNLEINRAIRRKAYYVSRGNNEKAAEEQILIEKLRLLTPAKPGGKQGPVYG